MSVSRKLYLRKRNLVAIFLAVALTCAMTRVANPGILNLKKQKKTIVLDSGHGGSDQGAKGPDGTFEKTVTLTLAQILVEELAAKYTVFLTRTDDYWLDPFARTSKANHLKADLFISLHTGGSFLHQASGISLFYYKKTSGPMLTATSETSISNGNSTQTPWSDIQSRHQKNSQLLADLIQHHIKEQIKSVKSEIQGAPIIVLEGADMPAILLEIGYITNPTEEKSFGDINVLTNISKGIINAIDDFFRKVG